MSSVDKVLGSRDLSDLIASYLPAKSASRLLQAQSRSIATECRNATIGTMSNDELLRCLRYAHRSGERDLETLMRREYEQRLHDKRIDVVGVARGMLIHDVRRDWYDRFVRPDGTFDYAQFQESLRRDIRSNPFLPQHHVEDTLRNMFVGKPELIALIPYLQRHTHWRHLAKLLVRGPLSDHAKRLYKRAKLISSKIHAAERFLRSLHTDEEKIRFGKQFDSANVNILLDAVRSEYVYGLWTTKVPLLAARMTLNEKGWIAEKAFFQGTIGGFLNVMGPLQASVVKRFEAFVEEFPEVRQSTLAAKLLGSNFAFQHDPEQISLFHRVQEALTPWSGTRRAWIETARAASVAAHGDSAPHTLPVD